MQDIRDTLEPEDLPASEFPWAVLLLIIPIVLLGVFLYRGRRRRHAPPLRPEAVARRKLEALAEIAEPRAFYSELTGILNQYLEARLHLAASRLTSIEIAQAFERIGAMGSGWQASLEALLAECDRAKFSEEAAAHWDKTAAIARARETIDLLAASVASAPSLANPWERFGHGR